MRNRYLFAGGITVLIIVGVVLGVVLGQGSSTEVERTFTVGETDFLLNGKKFQYVSGSFHYFRAFRDTWEHKLNVMKSAGLTVVDTYVEWATHNPEPGVYEWEGLADLEYFLELTQKLDLLVILRPGPYICAERDNGGLPYWLFTKYPNIKVRTDDPNYLSEVSVWYRILFERVGKYLLGRGGNIIMVQVENEYGVFEACNRRYMEWLRDETKMYVNEDAVLFTVDIPNERFECGIVKDVFITTDFGLERANDMDAIFEMVRKHQPTGPLVNSEYYPGWLTHWQEPNQRRDADEVARVLKEMLQRGVNVNFYMFFGGTNFGFTAGANDWGRGKYKADLTSYDYDAPMDEAGDATIKLIKIRNVIMEHFPQLLIPNIPESTRKYAYNPVSMKPIGNLFSKRAQQHFVNKQTASEHPLTFEEFGQFSGFLLYETDLPKFEVDPSVLTVDALADRALIYVDDYLVGTLSRENNVYSLPVSYAGSAGKLKILVENQGRINFNKLDDIKGILGKVTLQRYELNLDEELKNWTITGYPLTKESEVNGFVQAAITDLVPSIDAPGVLKNGPMFFYGELNIEEGNVYDTYLDPSGWSKGVLYVNGFNLGRYWPIVGPQITMYVPASVLKVGKNEIVMLELQKANVNSAAVYFRASAQLDGGRTEL